MRPKSKVFLYNIFLNYGVYCQRRVGSAKFRFTKRAEKCMDNVSVNGYETQLGRGNHCLQHCLDLWLIKATIVSNGKLYLSSADMLDMSFL